MPALFSWLGAGSVSTAKAPKSRSPFGYGAGSSSSPRFSSTDDGYADVALGPSPRSEISYPPSASRSSRLDLAAPAPSPSLPSSPSATMLSFPSRPPPPRRPLSSYPHPKATFSRLYALLDPVWPELRETLSYPVAPEDLANLRAAVRPYTLPHDVCDVLSLHDGQERESLPSDGRVEDWGLVWGLWFMRSDEIAHEYDCWRKLRDGLATVDDPFSTLRPMAPPETVPVEPSSCPKGWTAETYSHPGWIPLLTDGVGNYIGIDLDPPLATSETANSNASGASRPCAGQVIAFGRDIDIKTVIWPGGPSAWAAFLAAFVADLEAGEFGVLGKGGGRGRDGSADSSSSSDSASEDGLGDVSYFDGGIDRVWERETGQNRRRTAVGWRLRGEWAGKGVVEAIAARSRKSWANAGLFSPSPSPRASTASEVTMRRPYEQQQQQARAGPSSEAPRRPSGRSSSPSISLSIDTATSPASRGAAFHHPLDRNAPSSQSTSTTSTDSDDTPVALTLSPPSPKSGNVPFSESYMTQSPRDLYDDGSAPYPLTLRSNHRRPRPPPPPASIDLPTLGDLFLDEMVVKARDSAERERQRRSLSPRSSPRNRSSVVLPLSHACSSPAFNGSSSQTGLGLRGVEVVVHDDPDHPSRRTSLNSQNGMPSPRLPASAAASPRLSDTSLDLLPPPPSASARGHVVAGAVS
jgi:cell wall assembly regulator SMI1